jgi:hypothetical protein
MFPFKVLIDDSFINLNVNPGLKLIDKKHVLSIVNNYEDGIWRFETFQRYIWNNIAETALSFRERQNLIGDPASTLAESAKKLRLTDKVNGVSKEKDISKGSELAEIILYGIMKHRFNALPVVPKIFYKQNPKDNAKGADSVHIVLEGENDFSLWFGEAKFYNSIEDARLVTIIDSVHNSLLTEKLKKENSIITDLSDIDNLIINEDLKLKIKASLNTQESIDGLKPKLHIPILLLHECIITANETILCEEYIEQVKNHHKERAQAYFEKQINKIADKVHLYSEISFHIILFPVPIKKDIVDQFVSVAEFHQKL